MSDILPKGRNELTELSLILFEYVRSDIQETGQSDVCPVKLTRDKISTVINACAACRQAFPKGGIQCPCNSGYSKKYLLKQVNKIIQTGMI